LDNTTRNIWSSYPLIRRHNVPLCLSQQIKGISRGFVSECIIQPAATNGKSLPRGKRTQIKYICRLVAGQEWHWHDTEAPTDGTGERYANLKTFYSLSSHFVHLRLSIIIYHDRSTKRRRVGERVTEHVFTPGSRISNRDKRSFHLLHVSTSSQDIKATSTHLGDDVLVISP